MDPVTLKLKRPVAFGEESISELVLREPKAKDFRGLKVYGDGSFAIGDFLALASRLSNQPLSVIEELSVEDMTHVLSVVGSFFGNGLPTGMKPASSSPDTHSM